MGLNPPQKQMAFFPVCFLNTHQANKGYQLKKNEDANPPVRCGWQSLSRSVAAVLEVDRLPELLGLPIEEAVGSPDVFLFR